MSKGLLSGLDWNKGMKGLQLANDMMQKQQQPQPVTPAPMPKPQSAPAMSNKELAELYKRIYGGIYV